MLHIDTAHALDLSTADFVGCSTAGLGILYLGQPVKMLLRRLVAT